ncbi:unnamed protein product [Arabidopsis lyrata]|uniref:Uncharacterized protein n=2 Tax=Arabidopsis TaxID=3701 RepID=A0A8T1ZZM0_ARASU|nr:hypothetical protein ISN45_Aa06g012240 [Arabidopsis thaliana x Arabidopsis arenosa]KAG7564959.1 hypothetical protein ISN44_As10g016980 [Arabidopsis suecica]CAH8261992.1 unnamed protein product [Arabidopsis lyrata]
MLHITSFTMSRTSSSRFGKTEKTSISISAVTAQSPASSLVFFFNNVDILTSTHL